MAEKLISVPAPAVRRVRAYLAPVDRVARVPTVFDAALENGFDLENPPLPWIDLGWIQHFVRKSDSKRIQEFTGIPASPIEQVVQSLSAEISFEFLSWTKLSMALSTGSQHMNVLAGQARAAPAGCGSGAAPGINIKGGSTATWIAMESQDAATFSVGDIVAIDVDYEGQIGFVGTPVAGAYVRNPIDDVDYLRRVTFNISVVSEVTADGLGLAAPLLSGDPPSSAKVQLVTGFVDREGGSFHLEWSGLFVFEGTQGERIFYHYPRLQAKAGAEEIISYIDKSGEYERVLLAGRFLALPIDDPLDGERVLCYRSFAPAQNALV